jgi:acyltransferase family
MRNSNIEVLRLIAMFFIVLSHILKGSFQTLDTNLIEGTLSSNSIFLVDSVLSSLTCAGVGVDLFVLISGYFSIRFKLKSFVQLLFQILFYSLGVTIIASVVGIHTLTISDLRYCVPVSSGIWWFISSYMALYFVAPLINQGIDALDKRHLLYVICGLFFLNSFSSFLFTNIFIGADGFSFFNFVTLYVIGRYIAKYSIQIKHPLFIYLCCCLLVFVIDYVVSLMANHPFRPAKRYNDILVIMMSLCLLTSFLKINLQSKLINSVAGSTLAIYLIHVHPVVFDYVLDIGKWINLTFNHCLTLSILIKIGIALTICVVGVIIDRIRICFSSPIVMVIVNCTTRMLRIK